MQYYVGLKDLRREVFRCAYKPTVETHGHVYGAVIGPFKTKRGASFMARCGYNNPHCVTVKDAECLAKKERDGEI